MNKIRRFLAWPRNRKLLFFRTLLIMAGIRIALWVLPARYVSGSLVVSEISEAPTPPNWRLINDIVASVRLCSRFIPQSSCLTQALAAQFMLRRIGQGSSLKIGVDKENGQRFRAHAWIEVAGRIVLGKVQNIDSYTIMSHERGQPA